MKKTIKFIIDFNSIYLLHRIYKFITNQIIDLYMLITNKTDYVDSSTVIFSLSVIFMGFIIALTWFKLMML